MRGDINFKVSDSSDLSVYFLFCGVTAKQLKAYIFIEKIQFYISR